MIKNIITAISSTMQINPDDHSMITSPNRVKSLGYAVAGWLYMLRHQKNTRIQAIASILVFTLAIWLGISTIEWSILILTITVVWMAEFINAAVEATVNLSTQDYHPMAKVAKDVASAAVLLGAIASILIGLLILGPPLLIKLNLTLQ